MNSEYIDGAIVPRLGGTTNHNRITLNVSAVLNFAFRQQDHEIFMSDVRLWIPEKQIYTYPDIMVVVGDPIYFSNRTDTIVNPQVIIEVLSGSTEGYDHEGKFRAYKSIPTFQEYLLIDQTQIYIEQRVRLDKKHWSLRVYDEEDTTVEFSSIPTQISLADIYNKAKFAPATNLAEIREGAIDPSEHS